MATHIRPTPKLRELAHKLFDYSGQKFGVCTAERQSIASYWDEGTKQEYAIIRGGNAEVVGDCGGLHPRPEFTVELDADTVILCHDISCGRDVGITIIVHPARMPQFLAAGPGELTRLEKIVLLATSAYKSSYAGDNQLRFHQATQQTSITRAEWEEARADLIEKRLLNKAGALTIEGRNAASQQGSLWDFRSKEKQQ